jgi:hypothetical protein
MWTAVFPATTWALVWFALVASAFLRLALYPPRADGLARRLQSPARAFSALLLLALLARLPPALLLPVGAGYDIDSFRLVGTALLNGEEVYRSAAAGRHPYLPFQMFLLGGALWAAEQTPLPFVVWIKLPAVLADAAITAVIFQTLRRRDPSGTTAVSGAALYALNPVSLLVSAYHGQFDALPTLLLLLAWSTWRTSGAPSAIALGAAILNKSWPLVFLPIVIIRLRTWRDRLGYTLPALGIPLGATAVYLLVFNADPLVLARPLTHTGVPGYWGISAVAALGARWVPALQPVYELLLRAAPWLLLLAGLLALWRTRRQSALDALVTTILTLFAVSVGMGIQWLLWVTPFALLAGERRRLMWYSMTAVILLLTQLYGLQMVSWAWNAFGPENGKLLFRLASLPPWAVTTVWALQRLRSADRA